MVKFGKSVLNYKQSTLWRFLSLDKFIDLLETQTLYFAPLSSLSESDPFEGFLPASAIKIDRQIIKKQFDKLENTFTQIASQKNLSSQAKPFIEYKNKVAEAKKNIKTQHQIIHKSVCVNCWHVNEYESEAMWRIYSESSKGIALQTNLDLLKTALSQELNDKLIQIGMIKYLDFFDENIPLKEYVVDGHLAPLLKRKSFEHEKELRLFIVPNITPENVNTFKPKPILVPIKPKTLIRKIIVSPYSKEPYYSSVCTICKKYGLSTEIVLPSALLTGHDKLISILDDI
jgi:hypothetical protein